MEKIDLSSLTETGKLRKPLLVSIRNIGKGIKIPHELHLAKVNFITKYREQLFSSDTFNSLKARDVTILANGAIYVLVGIDFKPEWKDSEEEKKQGGWIFARMRICGFIHDNNGMAIVGDKEKSFRITLSEEDIEIFEIEKFTES